MKLSFDQTCQESFLDYKHCSTPWRIIALIKTGLRGEVNCWFFICWCPLWLDFDFQVQGLWVPVKILKLTIWSYFVCIYHEQHFEILQEVASEFFNCSLDYIWADNGLLWLCLNGVALTTSTYSNMPCLSRTRIHHTWSVSLSCSLKLQLQENCASSTYLKKRCSWSKYILLNWIDKKTAWREAVASSIKYLITTSTSQNMTYLGDYSASGGGKRYLSSHLACFAGRLSNFCQSRKSMVWPMPAHFLKVAIGWWGVKSSMIKKSWGMGSY